MFVTIYADAENNHSGDIDRNADAMVGMRLSLLFRISADKKGGDSIR
jgi:hypothetical protein